MGDSDGLRAVKRAERKLLSQRVKRAAAAQRLGEKPMAPSFVARSTGDVCSRLPTSADMPDMRPPFSQIFQIVDGKDLRHAHLVLFQPGKLSSKLAPFCFNFAAWSTSSLARRLAEKESHTLTSMPGYLSASVAAAEQAD